MDFGKNPSVIIQGDSLIFRSVNRSMAGQLSSSIRTALSSDLLTGLWQVSYHPV